MTQEQIDKLADIIWWIKGALSVDYTGCPFDEDHVEALAEARIILMGMIDEVTL